MKLAASITAFTFLFASGESNASELIPLKEAFDSGAEASYVGARCSALYGAIIQYSGGNNLADEALRNLEAGFKVFVRNSVAHRVNSGWSQSAAEEQFSQELSALLDIYVLRFVQNRTLQGQAFLLDETVNSDLDFCAVVQKAIQ